MDDDAQNAPYVDPEEDPEPEDDDPEPAAGGAKVVGHGLEADRVSPHHYGEFPETKNLAVKSLSLRAASLSLSLSLSPHSVLSLSLPSSRGLCWWPRGVVVAAWCGGGQI
ncbi:hypothetical protein DY000_02048680 [Brassica cretica]|uniref:Uncharacterized protein n=1 Tax=Brassica cretica TaxID=69181 RepID=A0ABQ7ET22_BRACR|nr:hypothetical protein DY000_02048680 [Brassica cretica]